MAATILPPDPSARRLYARGGGIEYVLAARCGSASVVWSWSDQVGSTRQEGAQNGGACDEDPSRVARFDPGSRGGDVRRGLQQEEERIAAAIRLRAWLC